MIENIRYQDIENLIFFCVFGRVGRIGLGILEGIPFGRGSLLCFFSGGFVFVGGQGGGCL